MIIKDFMVPQKKSANAYYYKLMGMKPEEYEKDKINKQNKKRRKSIIGSLHDKKSNVNNTSKAALEQTVNSSNDGYHSMSDFVDYNDD